MQRLLIYILSKGELVNISIWHQVQYILATKCIISEALESKNNATSYWANDHCLCKLTKS